MAREQLKGNSKERKCRGLNGRTKEEAGDERGRNEKQRQGPGRRNGTNGTKGRRQTTREARSASDEASQPCPQPGE